MSQDQRPGRVRLFTSGAAAQPRRRRTDAPPMPEPAATATTPAVRIPWAMALLFLAASAVGGVAAAWLDLAGMLAR